MNIMTVLLLLIGFTYGVISVLAGLLGFKTKKIRLLSSFLMVVGGILILLSLVLDQNKFGSYLYILVLGLVLIHISAIRNGKEIYRKIHYKHHVIRLIISAAIMIFYIFH